MAIHIYTGSLYGSHSAYKCPSIYQRKAPGSFVTTNLAGRDLYNIALALKYSILADQMA